MFAVQPAWAQLSKDEAVVLMATARIAAAFPAKAQICGWTDGDMTWDILRYLAASHAIHTHENRKRISDQQAAYAAQKSVENLDAITLIANTFIKAATCDDKSARTGQTAWEKYVVTLRDFAEQEVDRLQRESGQPGKRRE